MLLTTGQAAEELDCAITTFRRLIRAGLLPGLSRRGVRVMVPLEVVEALRERSAAPLHRLETQEVAVLRADVAKQSQPGGPWTGFSASLSTDVLRQALHGWWRCDAASIAAGGVLPVTLSGYVVAVLTGLDRWEKDERGRHGFPDAVLAGYVADLAAPTKHLTAPLETHRKLADLLLGTRLASRSGGAIAYVATGDRSAN
ncbi:helix-turn-helix domain-containing protein [Streptomyces sp. AM2-3-1]|uniref:helix-turn-helix domain-containing protein n=1 Tax=Streptomyces sp. AM2-3-1 TaxID=3075824 RepID=UPI0028C3E829|nr:helix-turn-helix domain-containing protein [Streptomyces sp. AM2-3-1]WNO62390.1 helix-turn-helix domain-containing protein [Streptomyces sp. AM2-3-1]WNO69556.1 helix-turn-helix domain-containing protein [Streptomyces sp. AM2-3-1]